MSQTLRQEDLSPTLRALEPRSPVCEAAEALRLHLPQEETRDTAKRGSERAGGKAGRREGPGEGGGKRVSDQEAGVGLPLLATVSTEGQAGTYLTGSHRAFLFY